MYANFSRSGAVQFHFLHKYMFNTNQEWRLSVSWTNIYKLNCLCRSPFLDCIRISRANSPKNAIEVSVRAKFLLGFVFPSRAELVSFAGYRYVCVYLCTSNYARRYQVVLFIHPQHFWFSSLVGKKEKTPNPARIVKVFFRSSIPGFDIWIF